MMMMMMTGVLSTATPAARDDAPVRSSERRVAQSVEDRVDRAVDIAQPVPWHTQTDPAQCTCTFYKSVTILRRAMVFRLHLSWACAENGKHPVGIVNSTVSRTYFVLKQQYLVKVEKNI